jgi:hypothetical protein
MTIEKKVKYPIKHCKNEQIVPKRKAYSQRKPPKVSISKIRNKPNVLYKHIHKKTISKKTKIERSEGLNKFMKRNSKAFKSSGILQRSKLGRYLRNFKPI